MPTSDECLGALDDFLTAAGWGYGPVAVVARQRWLQAERERSEGLRRRLDESAYRRAMDDHKVLVDAAFARDLPKAPAPKPSRSEVAERGCRRFVLATCVCWRCKWSSEARSDPEVLLDCSHPEIAFYEGDDMTPRKVRPTSGCECWSARFPADEEGIQRRLEEMDRIEEEDASPRENSEQPP